MHKNGTVKNGTVKGCAKEILKILVDNPAGLTQKTIQKLLNKPRRTVYNNLNKLKQQKIIENIFPIWRCAKNQSNTLKMAQLLKNDKTIELHDFSFVVRLINKPHWWNKKENKLLKLKDFMFKDIQWGNQTYYQLTGEKFIIQLFSESMIFINRQRYVGNDPYDCFIQATKDFIDMNRYIESILKFKFFKDGIPQASVRTQHLVQLNNYMAKKCIKEGNLFKIFIEGELRLLIDSSNPQGLEAVNKNHAVDDMNKFKKWSEDYVRHENPPVITEIMESIKSTHENITSLANVTKGIQENQLVFDKNMSSHLAVLNKIGDNNEATTHAIQLLSQKIEQMNTMQQPKKRYVSQTLLNLMNNIKKPEDVFNYPDQISLLNDEDKSRLTDYLFNLRK